MFAVDGDQDDRRHILEVACQVGGGIQGPFAAVSGARYPFGVVDDPVATGFPVDVCEPTLGLRVADHQPAPAGLVAAGGGLLGKVYAVEDQILGDVALEVEAAPYRPGCRQQAVGLVGGEGHVVESTTVGVARCGRRGGSGGARQRGSDVFAQPGGGPIQQVFADGP